MPRSAKNLFWALSSLALAACGADSSSPSKETPAPEETPITKAYDALTAGEQGQVTQVITDLDDAVAADPSDGRTVFYSGLMRFWQLGEEIDLPANSLELLPIAQTMVDRLREAQGLLPDDDRAPAFGGLGKVVIGNRLGLAELKSEGMADIEHGVDIFPAYSNFLRALASADSAADTEDFATVVPHMQAVMDTCGMKKDAKGAYAYLEGPLPSRLRPCNDDGIVPHVWEGYLLSFGDVMLKAGKTADEARAVYEAAKLAPRFDKWPFASAIEDRIEHADERAALYADGDAANDPVLWLNEGHICTGCHQDNR